jgi:hypothetical protein
MQRKVRLPPGGRRRSGERPRPKKPERLVFKTGGSEMTVQAKVFDLAQSAKNQTRQLWGDLTPRGKVIASIITVAFFWIIVINLSDTSSPSIRTIKACPSVWALRGVSRIVERDKAAAWKAFHDYGCVEVDPNGYEVVTTDYEGFKCIRPRGDYKCYWAAIP